MAPIAVDDAATTLTGTAIVVAVLDNDSDPNTAFLSQGLHVTGLTVTSGKGTASITADGRVRVVPTGTYTGPIVVTYTIADDSGATATATLVVTVTATPPAPEVLDGSMTMGPHQRTTTIDPATDVTGHGALRVTSVHSTSHRVTVTVEGNRLVVHRHDSQPGTVTFTYVVVGSDGVQVTVTETVHLLGLKVHTTGDAQASALPHTGADVVPAGILGIALTLAGALACLFTRQRKEQD
jgi:large repetitive protein